MKSNKASLRSSSPLRRPPTPSGSRCLSRVPSGESADRRAGGERVAQIIEYETSPIPLTRPWIVGAGVVYDNRLVMTVGLVAEGAAGVPRTRHLTKAVLLAVPDTEVSWALEVRKIVMILVQASVIAQQQEPPRNGNLRVDRARRTRVTGDGLPGSMCRGCWPLSPRRPCGDEGASRRPAKLGSVDDEALHRLLVIDDSQTIRKLVELVRGMPFALEFREHRRRRDREGSARSPRPHSPRLRAARHEGGRGLRAARPRRPAPPHACDHLFDVGEGSGVPSREPAAVPDRRLRRQAIHDRFRGVSRDGGGDRATSAGERRFARLAAAAAGASPLGPRDRDAAAKVLYARLARQLASVPDWLVEAGAAPESTSVPAFLARKLLTPEVVSSLLKGSSHCTSRRSAQSMEPRLRAPEGDGPALHGEVPGWPLVDLLAAVGTSGRTGELALSHGSQRSSPTSTARSCSAPPRSRHLRRRG